MKKINIFKVLLVLIFGSSIGLIISDQILHIWSYPSSTGILLLVFSLLVSINILGLLMYFFFIIKLNKLPTNKFCILVLGVLTVTGLVFSNFSPLQSFTPDKYHTLSIQPKSIDKSILIEEIRINNNPIKLTDFIPSKDWRITPFGIESDPGAKTPFVFQKRIDLTQSVDILFGKGPSYGQSAIRLDWDEAIYDFNNSIDSEFIVRISSSNSFVWYPIIVVSYWLVISFLILFLILLVFPIEVLDKITEFLDRKKYSISFWIILSYLGWYWLSFVKYVFFDPSHMMNNNNFLPAIRPIGNDLKI